MASLAVSEQPYVSRCGTGVFDDGQAYCLCNVGPGCAVTTGGFSLTCGSCNGGMVFGEGRSLPW